MVQSVETEPFSDDGSTQASGVMAGLPPLLLGTYTQKSTPKDVWHCLQNFVASWDRAW